MPINGQRTAWILGAGFSRSLGGPLLADLFRQEYRTDLDPVLPDPPFGSLVDEILGIQALFNAGRDEDAWQDAEEFLAIIDAAYGTPRDRNRAAKVQALIQRARCPFGPRLNPAGGRPVIGLLKEPELAIRRALAFECSRFVSDPAVQDEAWLPYRAWAASLHKDLDTVITFNYDTVLESLKNFHIRLPPDCVSTDESQVPVYKLHGSVEWIVSDKGNIEGGNTVQESLRSGARIAIAAPGRSKAAMTDTTFDALWVHAIRAIEQATTVVIVGYSFPKTDAAARMKILDAVSRRTHHMGRRAIHLVLGPDTGLSTSRRVVELLRYRTGDDVWV